MSGPQPASLPPVQDRTVPAVLEAGARLWGDKIAMSDRYQSISYADTWLAARRRASALVSLTGGSLSGGSLSGGSLSGGKGTRVLTLADNHVDAALTWLGIATAGLVEVPVNTAYRASVLTQQIVDSGASWAVSDAAYVDRLVEAAQGTQLRDIVVRGDQTGEATAEITLHPGAVFDEVDIQPLPPVTGSDPMAVMYTSGTTGTARGVLVTQAHAYTYGAPQILGFAGPDDVAMVVLPLFHVGGQWAGLYNALIAGATAHISARFDGQHFWDEARAAGCTCALLVVAMANYLLQREPRADDADNPFRRMMLSPVPSGVSEFAERFGVRVCTGYGSTEAGTVFTAPFDQARPQACGWPRDGVETRVVGPDDLPVAPGQVGEVIVRSQEPWTMMSEYIGRYEDTVAVWRNLWYHTGDAMYVDDDGQYVYVDRLGDAIRRRGENVPSAAVESVINRHPAVLECAVVGVGPGNEHEILATVVLRPDTALDPTELLEWSAEALPHFMVPRYIDFVDELERTPSGKIRKRPLRERGVERAWDREAAGIHVGRDGLRRAAAS